MFGVIPKTKDQDQREQKLIELQKCNRESHDLKDKCNKIQLDIENIKSEVSVLVESLNIFKLDIYGDPQDGDTDTVDNGFIHNFKSRLDEQRDEYYNLVEKYMNELDKKRLDDIESRLARLEEGNKPKINIVSSRIPQIEIEKKFERSQTTRK